MDELTAKTMTPVALFGRHTSTWRTDSTTDTITRQWVVSCLPVLSSQTLPGQLNHSHFPISFPQTVLQSSIQLSAAMCMKDKFSITPSTSWSLYRPYTHMRKCTHTHTHTQTLLSCWVWGERAGSLSDDLQSTSVSPCLPPDSKLCPMTYGAPHTSVMADTSAQHCCSNSHSM